MSSEHFHSDKWNEQLRRSFDAWDAGDAPDLWENISDELSVEKVWSDIGNSLDAEVHAPDEQLRAAYHQWNAGSPKDLWTKLDESLSVEQVWMNLSQTLERPIAGSSRWLRIAVASILVLFVARHVNDETRFTFAENKQPGTELAAYDELAGTRHKDQLALTAYDATAGTVIALQQMTPGNAKNTPAFPLVNPVPDHQQVVVGNEEAPVLAGNVPAADSAQQEIDKTVNALALNEYNPSYTLAELVFPSVRSHYDHWILQAGAQFSSLMSSDPSGLTSSRARAGLAADLGYRYRWNNLQFTGTIGLSQFSQEQGKYINARYRSTQQKINMLQMSLCLGYTMDRIHFYGGAMVSNALTALEFNGSTITQIYNFRTIEPGMTAGIDYRLFNLRGSRNNFSIGAQYQYLPDNRLNKYNLNQIHGLRIQAKISF